MEGKYYLLSETKFVMGDEEAVTQYHSNGTKSKQVVKNGVCNEWFDNGSKKSEWVNVKGVQSNLIMYLKNGNPSIETRGTKKYYFNDDESFGIYGALDKIRFDSSGYIYTVKYSTTTSKMLEYITKVDSSHLARFLTPSDRDIKWEYYNGYKSLLYDNRTDSWIPDNIRVKNPHYRTEEELIKDPMRDVLMKLNWRDYEVYRDRGSDTASAIYKVGKVLYRQYAGE
jgi:hypothetical protein